MLSHYWPAKKENPEAATDMQLPSEVTFARRTKHVVDNSPELLPPGYQQCQFVYYVPDWVTDILWECLAKIFVDIGPVPSDDEEEQGDSEPRKMQREHCA